LQVGAGLRVFDHPYLESNNSRLISSGERLMWMSLSG
jgi:hypothetical protein